MYAFPCRSCNILWLRLEILFLCYIPMGKDMEMSTFIRVADGSLIFYYGGKLKLDEICGLQILYIETVVFELTVVTRFHVMFLVGIHCGKGGVCWT